MPFELTIRGTGNPSAVRDEINAALDSFDGLEEMDVESAQLRIYRQEMDPNPKIEQLWPRRAQPAADEGDDEDEGEPAAYGHPGTSDVRSVNPDGTPAGQGGRGGGPFSPAPGDVANTEPTDEVGLGTDVTVADLPAHLAGIDSVEEIQRLQAADERVTAQPVYEARLRELEQGQEG